MIDYEVHNYLGSAEIIAVHDDRPSEVVARFTDKFSAHDDAAIAFDQIINV